MARQLLSLGLCAAAAVAMTAEPARAQVKGGLFPGYHPAPAYPLAQSYNPGINRYSGYVPYPGYSPGYDPGFARSYARIAPAGLPTSPTYSRFYVPSAEDGAAPADSTAHITVHVPGDATVWFDGWQASLKGPVRKFESPPLTPGRQYVYTVRARWEEVGREVTQTREVTVTAGTHVRVRFPEKPGAPPSPR